MGLPRPFLAKQLKQLGQAIALDPSYLVYKNCREKFTNKGFLIFKVCSFVLFVSKTLNLGGYDIQFIFLNHETHCHECGHASHTFKFYYLLHKAALFIIYVDNDNYLSFSP